MPAQAAAVLATQAPRIHADPVAAWRAEATCGFLVLLDGSPSRDEDGLVVRWVWDLGDGRTADGPRIEALYGNADPRDVVLTVWDDTGRSAQRMGTVAPRDCPAPLAAVPPPPPPSSLPPPPTPPPPAVAPPPPLAPPPPSPDSPIVPPPAPSPTDLPGKEPEDVGPAGEAGTAQPHAAAVAALAAGAVALAAAGLAAWAMRRKRSR